MRKVMLVVAVTVVAAGMAFAFKMPGTFPVSWPYDGLVTNDHGGLPLTPNALHFNVGVGYLMATEAWLVDPLNPGSFELTELGGDATILAVPIDVGYAFDERILVDVTLQIFQNKFAPDTGDEVSAFGLGDVWVKGRYIAPMDGFNLGGRLGVKIPVGKVDYTDTDAELGDDQMDIDVAAVGSMYPDYGFAFNGQFGFRYRMARTLTDPLTSEDYDYTPGMLIYLDVAPGYTMGPDNFQIYVPIGYEMSFADDADGTEVTDSESNGLYVGVAPKYGIDANNTIGAKFLYPIMGQNVHKALMFGFTYEGYLPM